SGYIRDGRQAVRSFGRGQAVLADAGQLQLPRWYPGVTLLPGGGDDDELLVVGGHRESYVPSDPARNNPTAERLRVVAGAAGRPKTVAHVAGPWNVSILADTAALLDPTTGRETALPSLESSGVYQSRSFPYLSPAVLLPLSGAAEGAGARVMVCGGATTADSAADGPATAACSSIVPEADAPAWTDEAPMPVPRVLGDAMLLPDGTVLMVNGAKWGTADGAAGYGKAKDPAYEAVLYSPGQAPGSRWRTLASASISRLYHSSALLIPDGRVLALGSDQQNWAVASADPFEYRIEAFSPPYLKLAAEGGRWRVASGPGLVHRGETFELDVVWDDGEIRPSSTPGKVARVTMLRYETATHSSHSDGRLVEAVFESVVGGGDRSGRVRVSVPRGASLVLNGAWMVFVLDERGVPSVAWSVRVAG
ncbi:hypothetical protein HK405_013654, partial [Cladochytrium tenue]